MSRVKCSKVAGMLEKDVTVVKAQDRLLLKEWKQYCKYRRYQNKYGLEGIRRKMIENPTITATYNNRMNRCKGILLSREADRKDIKAVNQCLARR